MKPLTRILIGAVFGGVGVLTASLAGAASGRTEAQFQVTNTGAAQYSIPIVVPPGVNGLTPQISLGYSSEAGNGLMGVGWNIGGLSAITRCPRTITQHGARGPVSLNGGNTGDVFCLDGNVLRLVGGSVYGAVGSVYRTESETYSRITILAEGASGPTLFKVERKDGLIMTFGGSPDTQIEAAGSSAVRAWLLQSTADRSGNAILYSYKEDLPTDTNGSYRPWKVQWNNRVGVAPLYTLEFIYETRPDPLHAYVAGGLATETQRLTRVDVTYNATITRRYSISYVTSSTSARSRVSQIQECGLAGDCYPATAFSYHGGAAGYALATSSQANSSPGLIASAAVGDFNGDGRADIIFPNASQAVYYALGNSAGTFDGPYSAGFSCQSSQTGPVCVLGIHQDTDGDGRTEVFGAAPPPQGTPIYELGTPGGPFTAIGETFSGTAADYDGDGRDDSVTLGCSGSTGAICVYTVAAGGNTVTQVVPNGYFFVGGAMRSGSYGSITQIPVDFNGDGRADLGVVTATNGNPTHTFRALISTPLQYVTASASVTYDATSATNFSSGFLPIDVNGDGCTDVLHLISPFAKLYRSNCGRSGTTEIFDTVVTTGLALPNSFVYPPFVHVADWDGDRQQDVLYAGNLYRSTGTNLASPVSAGLPARDGSLANSPMLLGDFNGDSQLDLLYDVGSSIVWVPHAGSTSPDLLNTATDGLGRTASVTYASTTNPGVHSSWGGGYPYQATTSPLWVVNGALRSDGNGGMWAESLYYYGAQTELTGRGWVGFGAMQRQENVTGTIQVEYFAQTWPHTGVTNRVDKYAPDFTLTQKDEITLASLAYGDVPTYTFRGYSYPSLSVRRNYELGGTLNSAHIRTESTAVETIDTLSGSPTSVKVTAFEPLTANGISPGVAYYSTIAIPSGQLLNDDGPNWCIGRANRVTVTNQHDGYGGSIRVRTSDTAWDAGKCRPSVVTVEPGGAMTVTTTLGYDTTYGNLTSESILPAGMPVRTRGYDYTDPTSAAPPGYRLHKIINEENEETKQSWDFAHGKLATSRDPNDLQTSWLYDSMGRMQRQTRPDGTYATFTWNACTSGCDPRVKIYVDANEYGNGGTWLGVTQKQYDALDRELYQYRDSPLVSGNWVVTNRGFDAKGRLTYEHMPWLFTATVFPYESFTYDALDRMTSRSRRIDDSNATTQSTLIAYKGRRVETTDPEGSVTAQTIDVRGQVVRSTDGTGFYVTTEYDQFGNTVRTRDADQKDLQLAGYNVRGFRESLTDIDLGPWLFSPNALGQNNWHRDANLKQTDFVYDKVGRLTDRNEPAPGGGVIYNRFQFGTGAGGTLDKGKLDYVLRYGGGGATVPTYSENYSWNNKGQLIQTVYDVGGATPYPVVDRTYNPVNGRLETLEYPVQPVGGNNFRLKIKYEYSNLDLLRIKDFNNNTTTFWQVNLNGYDARGNVRDQAYYNGLQTIANYDTTTGWIRSIQTGPGGGATFQNLNYTYYKDGNLKKRQDVIRGLAEEFFYDSADRLDTGYLNGTKTQDFDYFANGNIRKNFSLGGTDYGYDPSKIHAVTAAPGYSFVYDANGNIVTRNGSSVSWFANNLPKTINGSGGATSTFEYGPQNNYWRQTAAYGPNPETTTYVGGLWEKVVGSSITAHRNYIKVGDRTVGIWTYRSDGSSSAYSPLVDHLGSTDVITVPGTNGPPALLLVYESFEAFGNRRDASDWVGSPSGTDYIAIANTTRRGFTQHTMLDNFPLIHMNGRVMDPIVGRFMSADPFIDDEFDPQGYNRYSYVRNNPLSYTDPTGFASCVANENDNPGACRSFQIDVMRHSRRLDSFSRRIETARLVLASRTVQAVSTLSKIRAEDAVSFGVGFTPAGVYADLCTAALGKDCISGEEIGGIWRWAGILPGVSEVKKAERAIGAARRANPTDRLKEHLTGRDLDAARRESAGEVVRRKADGTPYDHVREVREAQQGLLNRIETINNRLSHPGTSAADRAALQRELSEASRLLDRSEGFLPR